MYVVNNDDADNNGRKERKSELFVSCVMDSTDGIDAIVHL